MRNSAIISIGNEILLGKTVNTNLAWLASELAAMGLPVECSITVKDDPEAIGSALRQCWKHYDVVISTGGLGPTDDDITKQEIARFFGRELVFDEKLWQHVQNLFSKRGLPTPQINRCQAMVPAGFTALSNWRGTAPGLYYSDQGHCFFAFAGVPAEMMHVFETGAKPILLDKYHDLEPVLQKTLHSFGISESALAEALCPLNLPRGVHLAWLPQTGRVDLRFYGERESLIETAIQAAKEKIGKYLWGSDEDTPVSVISALLREQGLKISIAESCTGGLLQTMLTDLAGSSDIYAGGVVSYSNELKNKLLGVSAETLSRHGAVSTECALEMVEGIKSLTNSQAAISVTGIAGPDGGTKEKAVGTVHFGFSLFKDVWSVVHIFSGDRQAIRYKAAEYALLHMIIRLQGKRI